jgi:isopenicillin-N epimerase
VKDFGRHLLPDWPLDPAIVYLNHGTVGVPPRRVLAAQQALRDEIERSPSRFMLRELSGVGFLPTGGRPRFRVAADAVAGFLGARGDDLVFVDNATAGVNAVLRSLEFEPGDEIVITDHVYGAVGNAARYVAGRHGAKVRQIELPWPARDPGEVTAAIEAAIGPNTKLVIADHITSESALLFPIADIAARCRAKGVPLLIDGAHAPGAIDLDIASIGADWYTGNLHKWCWSPRSCGVLWTTPARQRDTKPTSISWGYGEGYVAEFDWNGTKDPTPALAAPEGIAMMRELGIDAVRRYNHGLAWEGARVMCERWGTRNETPESMIGTMATVPLPEAMGVTKDDANRLRAALLYEDAIEVQLHAFRGRLWARISAQIYNDMSDVERLAEAVLARRPAARSA